MVIGKEINCNIGFNNAFSNPNTTATIIDTPKLFTETPGSNHAVKYTATLEIKICNNILIQLFLVKESFVYNKKKKNLVFSFF